jgi:Right handed beta helix region
MSRTIFIAAALALAATLPAVQAQAQSPRTFVSAAGTDNSTCSFAAPCRHFQAAVMATSAGGEVDALDPAGYGPIIISQAVTIEGQGWSYIAPPAGGNGITINAVSGNVSVHGVSLNGVGITGLTTGIQFNSGGSLTVSDSVIRNFGNDGIPFMPNGSSSQLYVSNTLVSDNSQYGITVGPSGSGITKGLVDNVKSQHNGQDGLNVNSSTQATKITISDSVSVGNAGNGISVAGGNLRVTVIVRNSTIDNNGGDGLVAQSNAGIIVTRSTVSGNSAAYSTALNGQVVTYGDNNFGHNDNPTPAPTQVTYE